MTDQNETRKTCPLRTIHPDTPYAEQECKKARCAWYDREGRMCAVLTLALTLDNLDREGIQTR